MPSTSCALQPQALVGETDAQEHTDAGDGEEVDKRDVAVVNGVPAPVGPVDISADGQHRIQVPKVGEQQTDDEGVPDLEFGGCTQDGGFEQTQGKIQVG